MKKKVLPVSLNKDQFSYLRYKSANEDVSMSQVIRELINREIDRGSSVGWVKGDSNG